MHTVFRIGEIKQIDKSNPLYQVELRLISDDDPQLRILTERIREEAESGTGWQRIGQLLLKISQFDKKPKTCTQCCSGRHPARVRKHFIISVLDMSIIIRVIMIRLFGITKKDLKSIKKLFLQQHRFSV